MLLGKEPIKFIEDEGCTNKQLSLLISELRAPMILAPHKPEYIPDLDFVLFTVGYVANKKVYT